MPEFTISAAARTVGTSRASIQRAIKSGRLSATSNDRGERVIDLSELLRVFGPLKGDADHPPTLAIMDGERPDTPERAPPEQGKSVNYPPVIDGFAIPLDKLQIKYYKYT